MGRKIANAQMLFNGVGVALVLPFLPAIARALLRLIPDVASASEREQSAVPAQ